MHITPEDTSRMVKAGVDQATTDFTARLKRLGFRRTKRMLWVRPHLHAADFVTLFRSGSSYGRPLNYSVSLDVGFGIRVLNDDSDVLIPNGPRFDFSERLRAERYHFRFNAQTRDTYDRCLDDLIRYVENEGEPFFSRFGDSSALLTAADSPLRPEEKVGLQSALSGQVDANAVALSLKLLGLAKRGKM